MSSEQSRSARKALKIRKQKKKPLRGFFLFLLLVDSVRLCDRIEFLHFKLLARVLLVLVVVPYIVGMAFTYALFVALGYEFDE